MEILHEWAFYRPDMSRLPWRENYTDLDPADLADLGADCCGLGDLSELRSGTLTERWGRHDAGSTVLVNGDELTAIYTRPHHMPDRKPTASTAVADPPAKPERASEPKPTPADRSLAVHEVSHCVVATALGVKVPRVYIHEDGGMCECDMDDVRRLDPEQHGAFNVAGWRGQIRAGLVPSWSKLEDVSPGDAANLRATLAGIGSMARPTIRGRAIRLADDLLADRWPTVEAVADALAQRGNLDGADVARILEGR